MKKTNTQKETKIIGKGKTQKPKEMKLSSTQEKLKKARLPYSRGRILMLVEYFKKNKPVEGKQYNAEVIYKGASSVPQIGTKGQEYIRKFLGFRVVCVTVGTHNKVFKVFTLKKIK